MEVFKLLAVAVAGVLWSAVLVVFLHKKDVHPIRELLDGFSRLGWLCKVSVLFLVAQLTMFGGAKHGGTNDVTNVDGVIETNQVEIVGGGGQSNLMSCAFGLEEGDAYHCPPPPLLSTSSISFTDILRGYRLESVATNDDISYTMPSNGMVRGTWHLTGAYEDVQKVSLGDFLFPLGTNLCSSLWTYTWGKVRPQLKNIVNEIAPVGAPMSATPSVSRFWTMLTANDTYLMTWESFATGRISGEATRGEAESFPLQNGIDPSLTSGEDTASPLTSGETPLPLVSAQIELFRNGDFIARSNNVESVYRRVIEPNPEPLNPYGPVQDLSVVNETNAYCWVDIVVNNADAWVRFEGDGPSNLADPRFAAKAGETNHVVILIGKTYKVTCDMEFTVVAKSDPAIDAWWEDDRTLWLNWPVTIEAWEGNGNSFRMHVDPGCLGGTFVWTESNCPLSGSGLFFSYSCDTNSPCSGCAAKGHYDYEGYAKDCIGGWCGCNYVPEEPEVLESEPDDGPYAGGAAVSFSDAAVIFEDGYVNMPGEFVPRQSTRTTLSCVAHGGTKGGTATFSISGDDKLFRVSGRSLPVTVTVPPEQKVAFEVVYEGQEPSERERDIVATATFTEEDGEPSTDDAFLTAVKVELKAVYLAPENASQNRHVYGVGEKVKLSHEPTSVSMSWSIGNADCFSELEEGSGGDKILKLHYLGGTTTEIVAKSEDVEYLPAISVIEPRAIVCKRQAWDGDCVPKGQAGGVGMNLWLYIEPMCVSFQGIDVSEIPCNTIASHSGYYSTTNFNGVLSHTLDADAGYWYHVREGNYWCQDHAWSNVRRPELSEGTMVWNIPIQWYQRLEASGSWPRGFIHADGRLIGGAEDAYLQEFNMTSEGTVKVTKHEHWVDRTTNDVIRLDGVVVHTGSH